MLTDNALVKAPELESFLDSLPEAFDLEHRSRERWVSRNDVAKQIRADIAAAIKRGVLPAGTKTSVRGDHNSIIVEVTEWHAPVFSDEYQEILLSGGNDWPVPHLGRFRRDGDPRLSPVLNAALEILRLISNRHNYDKSDTMTDYFDVGYYLTVTAGAVESAAREGIAEERDPALVELRHKAIQVAATLGPKVVRSVCGRRGVEHCSKWNLDHLFKLADRAKGRPLEYCKRRRGWFPVG